MPLKKIEGPLRVHEPTSQWLAVDVPGWQDRQHKKQQHLDLFTRRILHWAGGHKDEGGVARVRECVASIHYVQEEYDHRQMRPMESEPCRTIVPLLMCWLGSPPGRHSFALYVCVMFGYVSHDKKFKKR